MFEDVTHSINICSSFFAGSIRWMAPELILALVEDDSGQPPPISTHSDVYAFASVCFEVAPTLCASSVTHPIPMQVATGELPYPHRTNDRAVTVDILRGVEPSRGGWCYLLLENEDAFWTTLERCWNQECVLRPPMQELVRLLEGMKL